MTTLPGLQMRKARTDMSISVEEAATSLGLTERSLKALESDDYDKLPSAVYIRGYIRRYCSLLNIDESPVLKGFELLAQSENQQSMELEKKQLLANPQLRMAVYCAVGILLLLIAVVLIAEDFDEESTPYKTVAGIF
jgi:cytoskeletal protein RodZ